MAAAPSGASPSPRFSAHIGYLFKELPLERRPEAARRAGFAAVEHPDPREMSARDLRRILDDTGLIFAQTGVATGDPARGEKGLAALPGEVARFRADVPRHLDYAEEIGCRLVQPLAGLLPQGDDLASVWPAYLENLAFVADAAAARGMTVIVEAIGPGSLTAYAIDRTEHALEAIEAVAKPNLQLLFDVFHGANEGLDPVAFLEREIDRIAHIHLADAPGRHEPGTGTIDFSGLYAAVERTGYRGFLGCEYVPKGATEDGLTWMPDRNA